MTKELHINLAYLAKTYGLEHLEDAEVSDDGKTLTLRGDKKK